MPILESLEAASCALLLMGAAEAPPGVVQEEVVEEVFDLLKHNLQHNVYCFVDGAARQLYRPHDASALRDVYGMTSKHTCDTEAGREEAPSKARGRGRGRAQQPRFGHTPQSREVLARVEASMALVPDLIAAVRLQPAYLLPYLHVALRSLSTPTLQQLQAHTSTALLAAFTNAGAERQHEVMSLLLAALLPSIAATSSTFAVDGSVSVHPATALVVLLVQASVRLPGHDEPPTAVPACFKAAFHWADTCWATLLDAVPQNKAAKSDADVNVKPLLEAFVAGMGTTW